jgi:hypothetical protein
MHRQWVALLSMVPATMPASGQDATPAGGLPSSTTQRAASIPDFSGLWVHPYFPAFEPPPSGPGPVLNKSRRRQSFDADGLRLPATNAPFVADPNQLVGDYTNPILKPQAAEVVKRHGEMELRGAGSPTPSNECRPSGVPFIFGSLGMQMLQQADKITVLYSDPDQFRQVRLNQSHAPRVTPSWYGDSVGHYEGNTLVTDTVGVKLGRYSMADTYGTPFTHALHVMERYRLVDYEAAKGGLERTTETFRLPPNSIGLDVDRNYKGRALQLQFTVEDEGVFATPWSATITYRRGLSARGFEEFLEAVCAENPHLYYSGWNADLPIAAKPDF